MGGTFIPLSVFLWNDLGDPVFNGGWRVLRAGPMLFNWPKLLAVARLSYYLPVLLFFSVGWCFEAVVLD